MPRIARVVNSGCPHHIIQRGNRKQKVFFTEEDKAIYLRILKKTIPGIRRELLGILSYG